VKYKAYPSYKDSGVKWLGEIPQHWTRLAIKRLSTIGRGASPRPIEDPKYFNDEGDYAWVRIADVSKSNGCLNATKQQLSSLGSSLSVKLEKGELFISIAGTVGKPCISNIKACIHDGFVYFPLLSKKYISLIYRVFESGECYGGLGKMGTQLNLNTETIGGISIAIAPDAEQKSIANYLDKATAKIDTLIEKQTKLIALLKEKRQAVISSAVTRGIDASVPMKDSGVEWLGEIPEGWVHSKLRYYLNGIKDGTHGTHKTIDTGKLLLSGKNIKNGKLLIKDNERNISEAEHKQIIKNGFPRKGDLLISVVGTIGQSCVYTLEEAISFQRSVCFLRVENEMNVLFLQYVFQSRGTQSQLITLTSQATVGGVYMGDIVELKITVPSLEEQQSIINYLDEAANRIDSLITKSTQAIELLKEKRTALISAAVTGKIDVRDVA